MSPSKEKIAAEAANHLSIGFLQGAGYVIAVSVLGLLGALIMAHPLGLLGGLIGAGIYFWRRRRRTQRLIPRQISEA